MMWPMMLVFATLAGLIHILIFCMESLWWNTPKVRARFRQTPEGAQATRLLAFNQGFYNLFLAAGVITGVVLVHTGAPGTGMILIWWNCLFMVGAAIVLLASSPKMWRGALIQGAAPLVFLALSAL